MKWVYLAVALMGINAFAKPMTAVVRLKNRVSMQMLAAQAQVSGRTYTPEEIRQLSGPSDVKYARTVARLRSEGLKIVQRVADAPLGHGSRRKIFATRKVLAPRLDPMAFSRRRRTWSSPVTGLDVSHERGGIDFTRMHTSPTFQPVFRRQQSKWFTALIRFTPQVSPAEDSISRSRLTTRPIWTTSTRTTAKQV